MADKKVPQLSQLTAVANSDVLLVIDDPGGTPVSKKIELEDIFGATSQTSFSTMDFGATGNSTIASSYLTVDTSNLMMVQTGMVVNEDGGDSDTRVESNNDENMIYVDAGNDRVGIRTNAPTSALDINSNSIRVRTAQTPANGDNSSIGLGVGTITWDTNYIYVAVNSSAILRASLSTF